MKTVTGENETGVTKAEYGIRLAGACEITLMHFWTTEAGATKSDWAIKTEIGVWYSEI
jgi:hypothetical protein